MRRFLLLLALLCSPAFLVGLGRPGLNDPDEGRNAEVGREMLASGDYVTPRLNETVYLDKPPVFFWAGAASMAILGVNETAARLPSALAAIGGILVAAWFARRRFGADVAWAAGFILALSPLYVVFGRLVIFDMLLLLCTTTSVVAAYEAMEGERRGRLAPMVFFAAAAVGTLTKGPVALVVPALIAIAWAFLRGRPSLLGRLRWGTGMLLYLVLVAPWPLVVEARHPGFLSYALLGENLARMTANPYETARPFYFYVKVILPGLFPWLLLVLAQGVAVLVRRLRGRAAEPPEDALPARYTALWLAVLYVFFSVITSKRPSYILPCAVPVAILAARLIVRAAARLRARAAGVAAAAGPGVAATEPAGAEPADLGAGLWTAAAGCAALSVAAWLVRPALMTLDLADERHAPLVQQTGLLRATSVALLACAVLLVLARRARRPGLVVAAAALPFLCLLPAAHAAAGHVEEARSSRAVSRFLASHAGPNDRIVCFGEYKPGINFYLQAPIWQVAHDQRVFTSNYIGAHAAALSGDPGFRLLTNETLGAALRDPASRAWILTARKEYDGLRDAVGGVPLDVAWEAGGFVLLTRAARAVE